MNRDNPWVSIWLRPSDTIREVLDQPMKWPLILVLLSGIVTMLDYLSNRSWGDFSPIILLLLGAIVIGPIAGLVGWFIGGGIFYGMARLFGGVGDFHETLKAVSWSLIPIVVKGTLWLPLLLIYGREMFTSDTPVMASSFVLTILFLFISLLDLVVMVWQVVILSHAIGEVHAFSAWKGFASVISVPLAFVLLLFIISGLIYG
ncbi:Yip1 family protein [Desmospora activa]|uniref:Yip1-like protein n=1 Tax=Desmospora activa DSM 45169 TaxID=1121389 RepID=A0A2T4Z1Z5_9BACL|nr:Yip1 family protein [Desmospora activa]PTM54783.1 Yip1-like protein [Desmospora activa DSM 45169]